MKVFHSTSDGINLFSTTEFLDVWWEYNTRKVQLLNRSLAHSYLQRAFCVRRIWNLVRAIEACGAGVADYTDLDWRVISSAQFREFLEAFLEDCEVDLLILPRVRKECLLGKLTIAFAEELKYTPWTGHFWGHRYNICRFLNGKRDESRETDPSRFPLGDGALV